MKSSPKSSIFKAFFLVAGSLAASVALAQVEVYEGGGTQRSGYIERGSGFGPQGIQTPQGEGQPQLFWVRSGQRIYCANCNLLLMDTVAFRQLPAAQTGTYYDDGTHGDDFPNDGVPTLIIEERDQSLGEYCWNIKLKVENYAEKVREMTAREFYDIYSGTFEQQEQRSLIIPGMEEKYAGPPEPRVVEETTQVTSIPEMEAIKRDFVEEYEILVVSRYQNYDYQPDYITFPPEIYGPRVEPPEKPQKIVGPVGAGGFNPLARQGFAPGLNTGGRLAGPYDATIGRAQRTTTQYGARSPVAF